ncbi:hypothetical protein H1S01_19760 [Heliobacterium chlorum]|uniref:Lipoprotein n=1 Tax=Heliobacterium chlorum TaxID=2698 RepID=A0ABR7TA38_HELCL|nr:hypothetical protein [Heliobacterium chlorum]MBC9786681.1 hypothetical protein [Heliobacterium chlorum]
MVKSKYLKMALNTAIFAMVINFATGCENKLESAQAAPVNDTTKDTSYVDQTGDKTNNSNEVKLGGSDKLETKIVEMDANTKKKLNTFFSNFSEAYVQPFDMGKIDNENLIRFGLSHIILNNEKLIEKKGNDHYWYINADYVNNATLYYFGEQPTKHISIENFIYDNGYYKFRPASGGAYVFSQIDKLFDLGNGTYEAVVNVYMASSGFSGDPHGTIEQWKASGEEIPELDKKINAVIKKIEDEGKERYILLEYK